MNGTDFEDFFQDRGDLLDWACETLGDNFCADESYERREWLTQTPWLWVILPVFALALSSFAHAGAATPRPVRIPLRMGVSGFGRSKVCFARGIVLYRTGNDIEIRV